jgi:hypothetical protein
MIAQSQCRRQTPLDPAVCHCAREGETKYRRPPAYLSCQIPAFTPQPKTTASTIFSVVLNECLTAQVLSSAIIGSLSLSPQIACVSQPPTAPSARAAGANRTPGPGALGRAW